MGKVPHGPTIKAQCKALGCWPEYWQKRDAVKALGVAARESAIRTYESMRIGERYAALLEGKKPQSPEPAQSEPAPGPETVAADPVVEEPVSVPDEPAPDPLLDPAAAILEDGSAWNQSHLPANAEVGSESMSPVEEILWARDAFTLSKNSGSHPGRFPSVGCMFWYQVALTNPSRFEDRVLKSASPSADNDDEWMRDGQHQIAEIETQLKSALREVGLELVEIEAGFSETLNRALSACAEGAGEQPAIPA